MQIRKRHGVARLLNKGILLPAQPGENAPELPRDITDLSDKDLMEIWSQYTAWTDFMAVQAAIAYSLRADPSVVVPALMSRR